MYYDINYLNKYKDGTITARAISNNTVFHVEAEIYQEDGEDPLIKAHVIMESTKSRSGASGYVYLSYPLQGINHRVIEKAIEEFLLG